MSTIAVPAMSNVEMSTDRGTMVLHLPSAPPSFEGAPGLIVDTLETPSAAQHDPLIWSYAFEAKMSNGLCGTTLRASIPLVVTAVPPNAADVQPFTAEAYTVPLTADPWSPRGVPTSQIIPRGVAAEIGYADMHKRGGKIEPTGKAVNMYHPEDDYGNVQAGSQGNFGAPNLVYQPVAMAFPDSPSETGRPAALAGQVESLEALENELGHSFDQRAIVAGWVAANPEAAKSMTPDEVGRIMSKCIFFQAAVAEELAIGLGPNLTCEHILAAMCSLGSRGEVARAMAPRCHRSAESGRQAILSKLFGFEKEEVAQSFGVHA